MVGDANKVKTAEMSAVVDSLAQLSFAVIELLARVADAHELSPVQMRLLGILRDREPGMFELAQFLKLDKSSVTGLVDRAEKRGLVERGARADDKRAVLVKLTATGRKLAAVLEKEASREMALLVSTLNERERAQLVALSSKILEPR